MKAILTCLLIAVMLLSLCSCGTSHTHNNVEITEPTNSTETASTNSNTETISQTEQENEYMAVLTAEPWQDLMTDGAVRIVLFKDGTGNLSADSDVAIGFNYAITWELNEDYIFVKSSQAQFPLYIIEEEGVIKLQTEAGGNIYVAASQFDEIRANTKLPTDELLIEIINNDGEIESLKAKELIELEKSNGVRFENKYFGAEITVISSVKAVHGSTILNGHSMNAYIELNGGWIVEVASENDVMNLNPGDIVKITGNIFTAFGCEVYIYIVNGHTTTIELYTE